MYFGYLGSKLFKYFRLIEFVLFNINVLCVLVFCEDVIKSRFSLFWYYQFHNKSSCVFEKLKPVQERDFWKVDHSTRPRCGKGAWSTAGRRTLQTYMEKGRRAVIALRSDGGSLMCEVGETAAVAVAAADAAEGGKRGGRGTRCAQRRTGAGRRP